jgi:hypothetical protein
MKTMDEWGGDYKATDIIKKWRYCEQRDNYGSMYVTAHF